MNILALSPHPDDVELGCGASLSRFMADGHIVHHVVFCAAENIGAGTVEKSIRWDEFFKAQIMLGIKKEHVHKRGFSHRKLYKDRSKILDYMVALRESIHPELVFIPCIDDLHQDHAAVTSEALRVFKGVSILGYEMNWNNLQFKAQSFIKVSSTDMQHKIDALKEYKTQESKPYMNPDFSIAAAKVRGVQIGARFAEAFEVIRWVQ